MLDQIMTMLIAVFGVVLIFAAFFFTWVLWQVRDSISKLFAAIGAAWTKSKEDTYTRDEMIYSINYFRRLNKPKSVIYWQSKLARKYPEEPYNG